jgi:sec-independent protein translocase protein TatC
MSFVDHLEQLRWHVIKATIAMLICTVLAFTNMDIIFHHILLAPARNDFWTFRKFCEYFSYCVEPMKFSLQSRTMTGQFSMHITASFVIGFVASFPYIFYQAWQFIKPGLNIKERNTSLNAVFSVSLLFFIGVLFGYFMVLPVTMNFLINYQIDPTIVNQFDVTSYISMVCFMAIGCGLMFELPVLIYILSKLGMMTPTFMRQYRRHAVVVIMLISAILTPSPDMFSQLIIGIPLILLYEISIFISAYVVKKKEEEEFND